MKNIKRFIALALVTVMSMTLFGCMRDESTITVDTKNNIKCTESIYLDKQAYKDILLTLSDDNSTEEVDKQMEEFSKEFNTVKLDGVEYFYSDDMLNKDVELTQYFGMTINKDIFYMPISSAYKMMSDSNSLLSDGMTDPKDTLESIGKLSEKLYDMLVVRTVTLPDEITYTNGTLSADKKSVTFKGTIKDIIAGDGWYAMTAAGYEAYNNDTDSPSIMGVASGDCLARLDTVFAKDNVAVLSYDINGVDYQISYDGKTYSFIPVTGNAAQSKEGLVEGENTLTVTDVKGNRSSVTFTYDSVAPVIKGAKAGKTYKKSRTVRISDAQGINKISVNGTVKNLDNLKKSGSKYIITAKKKGKNVIKVTDNAGNVTKISFKIKK